MTAFVQYGCGLSAPDGWLNFDASPTLVLQRVLGRRAPGPKFPDAVQYGDIVRGLRVKDASAAGVYASHVLEHLALDDFRAALRNTYRMLTPGGVFRLVVPDLEAIARAYLAHGDAGRFLRDAHLGEAQRPRGVAGFIRTWLGNSTHRWMWDERSLGRELADAGFTGIRRCQYHDSGLPMFDVVEDDADRWNDAVGMEARRPA